MSDNYGHGGKREGAGAKKKPPHLKKNPISVKLPQWLIDWMDGNPESRAVIIENAVTEVNDLRIPK